MNKNHQMEGSHFPGILTPQEEKIVLLRKDIEQRPEFGEEIDEAFTVAENLFHQLQASKDLDRFLRFMYATAGQFHIEDVPTASSELYNLLLQILLKDTGELQGEEKERIIKKNKVLIETVLSRLTSIQMALQYEKRRAAPAEDAKVQEILKRRVTEVLERKEKPRKKPSIPPPEPLINEKAPVPEKKPEPEVKERITLEELQYRDDWEPATEDQGYKIGDQVVYPGQGVCEIISREEKLIAGNSQECFILVYEAGKVMLPVENAHKMAPLLDRERFEEFKLILQAHPARTTAASWNKRARALQDKIGTGNTLDAAEVLRDLLAIKADRELAPSEQRMLEKVRTMVYKELSIVCHRPESEIKEIVEGLFAIS